MGIKINETWIQSHWRPLLAVSYTIIILFDFVFAPVLWGTLQAFFAGIVSIQWAPLTLQAGGLFHIAICSILGITSFTRGKEKIERLKRAAEPNLAEGSNE